MEFRGEENKDNERRSINDEEKEAGRKIPSQGTEQNSSENRTQSNHTG